MKYRLIESGNFVVCVTPKEFVPGISKGAMFTVLEVVAEGTRLNLRQAAGSLTFERIPACMFVRSEDFVQWCAQKPDDPADRTECIQDEGWDVISHQLDRAEAAVGDFIIDGAKDTNPKDAIGTAKVPMFIVPSHVLAEVSLALAEGALKYGGNNWRDAGVRATVYLDATGRHLHQWRTGQDIDPKSNINHISKAIASLVVLRDAMLHDNWTDDRPPASDPALWALYDDLMGKLIETYGHIQPKHFTEADNDPA